LHDRADVTVGYIILTGSFEQGYNRIAPFDPLSLNNIPDTCVGNVNRYEHSICKITDMNTSTLLNKHLKMQI
jgi:hypothetical protein